MKIRLQLCVRLFKALIGNVIFGDFIDSEHDTKKEADS